MEKEKRKKPAWLIALIVVLVIAIFGAVGGNTDTDENSSSSTKTTEKKKLTLEESYTASLDEYGMFYYIEGYVNNPTDKDYSYVSIEFTAYDVDGNTLGTCLDNNSGLEKGGRWKFKASCIENVKQIASVKLKEITGY